MSTYKHAQAHEQRLRDSGLVKVGVWCPDSPEYRKRMHKYAQKLRREAGVKAPRD